MYVWKIIRVTASLIYRQHTPTVHQYIHVLSCNDITYMWFISNLAKHRSIWHIYGFSPMLASVVKLLRGVAVVSIKLFFSCCPKSNCLVVSFFLLLYKVTYVWFLSCWQALTNVTYVCLFSNVDKYQWIPHIYVIDIMLASIVQCHIFMASLQCCLLFCFIPILEIKLTV